MRIRFVALILAIIMAVPAFGTVSAFEEPLDGATPELDGAVIPTDDEADPDRPTDDEADLDRPTEDEAEPDYSMLDLTLSEDGSYYIISSCGLSATAVVIPEIYNSLPVKEIGEGAFYGCKALESVKIPQSVTRIRAQAFKYCEALEEINLPAKLISIGDEAFSDCESLKSIEIPASVRSIGGWVIAFCNNLESVTVAQDNKNYYSVDNCVIHKSSKTLVLGCNNSTIPEDGSVTAIGYAAFAGFDGISQVVIPESVTEIEASAFSYCRGLESVEIPASVEIMGDIVFEGCENLEKVYCEAESLPEEWSGRWIEYCDATVYWAGVPEEKPVKPEDSSDDSSDEPQTPTDDQVDEDEPQTPTDDQIEDEPNRPTDDQVDEDEKTAKGDISGNGIIDSMDYVYLKRAYFGTYKLKDITVGDLSGNGIIDSMDYVYLKRAYFGTYIIK